MTAGIPLLLLPQGSPSHTRMSDACQRKGVARVLHSPRPDPLSFDDALHALTTDERFNATAQQLAADIATMPSADDAITVIDSLDRA